MPKLIINQDYIKLKNKLLKEKFLSNFKGGDHEYTIYGKIDDSILRLKFAPNERNNIKITYQIELSKNYSLNSEIINIIQNDYSYKFVNYKYFESFTFFSFSFSQINQTNYNILVKKINTQIINIEKIIKIIKLNFINYKISSINLKQINQFKDLKIDLTYPKGHKKEGKALDKVCIIGQNGTGKTSILKIIKKFIEQKNDDSILLSDKDANIELNFVNNNLELKLSFNKDKFTFSNNLKDNISFNKNYINFPADIIYKLKNEQTAIPKAGIIDFNIYSPKRVWGFVKQEIIEYNKKEKKEREKLGKIEKIRNTETAENIKKISDKITANFVKWKKENPSPVEKLAKECLNEFLEKFQLQVKTRLNFGLESDINYIKIENLQGKELGNLDETLSTGTKQILYTAMPLYKLETDSTIVLFDEPERSLYPDVQKDIVDFYTGQLPDSQFFFATHSPIIASRFEPWEIVELRFNEKTGNVGQEKWFEGERHIDNYFKDARFLKWDSILMDIYGLKEEGNETIRNKEVSKAHRLKKQLEDLRKHEKTKTKEYKEKEVQFIKISKKLAWDI